MGSNLFQAFLNNVVAMLVLHARKHIAVQLRHGGDLRLRAADQAA
jgi:hypothetical protein